MKKKVGSKIVVLLSLVVLLTVCLNGKYFFGTSKNRDEVATIRQTEVVNQNSQKVEKLKNRGYFKLAEDTIKSRLESNQSQRAESFD